MARILLVEDDPDVRLLMEHVLHGEGYDVTVVETVAIATSLLASQPFDLVLVDANLPDGSGLTVAEKAKSLGRKALVITGYGLSLPKNALADFDYLLKPIRPAELLAEIRQRLSGRNDEPEVIPFPKPAG
jgi:DNA-binding response OmpR family regulator